MASESVYAKPVAPRIVVRPALASLALHGLLLVFLVWNWADMGESKTIEVKPIPKVINAKLVDASELQPAPKPKPQAKPKPKPQPKPKPEPKPEPRISEEELAAIARADMARAMAAEEQAMAAASTAAEMAASYAALIQQTVVNYWSRPPSARNGMEALLQIQLIPTGEVVSVTVLKSSGNTAFDRSAINAVEKAGSFPELKSLPPREFEKTFRRFRLLFRPEDLRY